MTVATRSFVASLAIFMDETSKERLDWLRCGHSEPTVAKAIFIIDPEIRCARHSLY